MLTLLTGLLLTKRAILFFATQDMSQVFSILPYRFDQAILVLQLYIFTYICLSFQIQRQYAFQSVGTIIACKV
uniref:Uncharacterized protein n=1 Tax=Solanum lycopersicum TaxID=4081 RepID=A0A3Q7IYG0_SOLLC